MSNATPTNPTTWESLILSDRTPREIWTSVFARLNDVASSISNPMLLHRETIVPDRLLAETAWDLWQAFPTDAPKVIDALRSFWSASSSATGTAILVLDALSLRELPLIMLAAEKRGIAGVTSVVRAAEVPTETNRFAAALGIGQRSKLANNQAPASFIFGGSDLFTDVLDCPFADCSGRIPAKPRVFVWHHWPDSPLIHDHAEADDGDGVVAAEIRRTLMSDSFWSFVDTLRQGRRLLICGDHGYASACEFSSEIRDDDSIRLFAGTFGAGRAIREDPALPWPRRDLPPRVLRFPVGTDTWLVVTGQRKWKVRGGFPILCHSGLSLLEAAVPVVELPAL